jgi:hypothetical protein
VRALRRPETAPEPLPAAPVQTAPAAPAVPAVSPEPLAHPAGRGWFAWLLAAGLAAALLGSRRRAG